VTAAISRHFVPALLALTLGGCATGTPGTVTDPTAKQKANNEKQKELSEMEEAGQRD
jgi:hypothetical protein